MKGMNILIIGDKERQREMAQKAWPEGVSLIYRDNMPAAGDLASASVIFLLLDEFAPEQCLPGTDALIFVHAVSKPTAMLPEHAGLIRINAWPGALSRPLLELAAPASRRQRAEAFLTLTGWSWEWVSDEAGMVTPRVISMIINEACYAVADGVSSPAEIDTAMKLGTGYPFGPFEWSRKIGSENIVSLLEQLADTDERYRPAPGMKKMLEDLA